MIGNHGIKTYPHVNVRLAMGKTIVLADTPALQGTMYFFGFRRCITIKNRVLSVKTYKILCSPHRHKMDGAAQVSMDETLIRVEMQLNTKKLAGTEMRGSIPRRRSGRVGWNDRYRK